MPLNKPLTQKKWLTYLDTTWKKCLSDAWQKEWDEMSREDITRMAREAGFVGFDGDNKSLRRFAELVAAAEREACAKVCDGEATIEGIAQRCAAAIRARGEA
jgi:hypothetical protein